MRHSLLRTAQRFTPAPEVLMLAMLAAFQAFVHPKLLGIATWPAPITGIGMGLVIVSMAWAWLATQSRGIVAAPAAAEPPRHLMLAVAAASLATAYHLYFIIPNQWYWYAALVAVCALMLGLWLACAQPRWAIAIAIGLGCALRLVVFANQPIHPDLGDMQPLVHAALRSFTHFEAPYQLYHMPWDLPLTYLPLTWLAYLPAYILGLDTRLTNIMAELLIGVALYVVCVPRRKLALLVWACMFILPIMGDYAATTTSQIFWLLLAGLLMCLGRQNNRGAAIMLGLCAATSLFVLVPAPFIGLYWLKHEPWRIVARRVGLAVLIALAIIAPFAVVTPQAFYFGVFQWFNDSSFYPIEIWQVGYLGTQASLSVLFWNANLQAALKPIQLILLGGLGWRYWRLGAPLRALPAFMCAAFLLFVAFNTVVWTYYYFAAFTCGLFAVAYVGLPLRVAKH